MKLEDLPVSPDNPWPYDDECPECGEDTYLCSVIKEWEDGEPVKAELYCSYERHERFTDASEVPAEVPTCGHTWVWER